MRPVAASELVDLSCVVHVHSTYSDGTATVPEILDAARANGVDCVLLTDHDTLRARREGWEGRHDGVLLLVGEEVSPRDGHYLAFGIDDEIDHRGLDPAGICDAVADAGGLGFAAHPFSQGSRISTRIGRPHPWRALGHPRCDGVELWSLATDAAESWRGARDALAALRRPGEIDGPPPRHLRAWDALCAWRRTVAIGGLDAHQPGLRVAGRVASVMPHRSWFGLLRTHVLVEPPPACAEASWPAVAGRPRGRTLGGGGTAADERARVYAALRAGRCYLALAQRGDPRGFAFAAVGGRDDGHGTDAQDDGALPMGAEAPWAGQTLRVAAPAPADLVLLRDGAAVAHAPGARALEHRTRAPGAFRVEARRDGGTWIVSNPIYLR